MLLANKQISKEETDLLLRDKLFLRNPKEHLTIVPTNRKARKTKKEIIDFSPNNSATTVNIETLTTFATKLLSVKQNFHSLRDSTSAYILRQSVESITPLYFNRYQENIFPKGTLEKIRNVISEYKRTGISPTRLTEEVSKSSSSDIEQRKAIDIAAIYSTYSERCLNLGALEIGDIYNKLLALSEKDFLESLSEVFPDIKVITLSFFNEIALPEVNILKRITSLSSILILISLDYNESNKIIFEALEPTLQRLIESGFIKVNSRGNSLPNEFSFITQKLFSPNKTNKKEKLDSVVMFNGKDKIEELEKIAKLTKDLIINQGVSPSRIAIVFNLISEYSPLLRTVFTYNNIPFNLSDRLTLDKSPVVSAIVSFLEISENGFYYKNLFRGISSGYISKLRIDAYNMMKVFRKFKLIAGYDAITSKLSDILRDLSVTRTKERNEVLQALNDLRKIKSILNPFEKELTAERFLYEFKNLIVKIGIYDTLLKNINIKGEENIKAVSSLLNSVNDVFQLIKKEYGEDTKHTPIFFLTQLRTIISWERFNIKERSDYGVQVTSVDEIRGLDFDFIFLAGMNDGNFPSKYSPEIFFADKFMKLENEHLSEERYKFYSIFERFKKKLFISYSLSENKKELSKSVFLSDLLEIIDIKEIEDNFFNSTISSDTDLLLEYGLARSLDIKLPENILTSEIERKIFASKERAFTLEGIYSGNVIGDEKNIFTDSETNKINLEKFKEKVFSITQFELFAKCPFKFFVERILKIDFLQAPNEDIEPIEIGSFLHLLLFKFYTKLIEEHIEITDDKAEEVLFQLSAELIDRFNFDDSSYFYEKEKIFGIAGNRKDSILYNFLKNERESNDGFIPSYFEVPFGMNIKENSDKRLVSSEPITIGEIKISGKIDRIDLNKNLVSIVDYKTGAPKVTNTNLEKGIDLQLPVYMFAALEMLGPGFEPAKMNIYSLKFNSEKFGKKEFLKPNKNITNDEQSKQLLELLDLTTRKIKEYFSEMLQGKFYPSRLNDREKLVCAYCDFRSVCRVDERETE